MLNCHKYELEGLLLEVRPTKTLSINKIFAKQSLQNLYYIDIKELIQESSKKLMDGKTHISMLGMCLHSSIVQNSSTWSL